MSRKVQCKYSEPMIVVSFEASQLGEVCVKVGNDEPMFIDAAELRAAVTHEAKLAIEALA